MNKTPGPSQRTAAQTAQAEDLTTVEAVVASSWLGKYRWSAILIALLVLLKFLIVPLFNWQNDTLTRIHSAQRSLQKMHALLQHRHAIGTAEGTLKAANKALVRKIYPAGTDADFQLQQQVWLEQSATAVKLRVKSIGWLVDVKLKPTRLTKRRAELRVSGSLAAMIRLLGHLQQRGMGVSIEKYSWSSRRIGANKNRVNGYFRVVFWSVSQ